MCVGRSCSSSARVFAPVRMPTTILAWAACPARMSRAVSPAADLCGIGDVGELHGPVDHFRGRAPGPDFGCADHGVEVLAGPPADGLKQGSGDLTVESGGQRNPNTGRAEGGEQGQHE